jgi:adenosylcobinamide-phosphate synthase
VLNTADAMWGYRDARYERFGKAAARLDDLANLPVAPLGAAAIALGAAMAGERGREAWRLARLQHGRTASPNAGWPMAAIAGALGVGLAKRGAYRLGEGPLPDSAEAIRRALRVVAVASAVSVILATGVAAAASRVRRGRG